MGRLSRGWPLTKLSFNVIGKDREILFFPIISGIALLIIWRLRSSGSTSSRSAWRTQPLPVLAAFFIAFYFLCGVRRGIFQCGTGLLRHASVERRQTHLLVRHQDGLSRLKYITEWALLSATVGLVLQAISSRSGDLGKLVIGLVGFAWSVATYFVVPIIAFEQVGPLQAIKRSASGPEELLGRGAYIEPGSRSDILRTGAARADTADHRVGHRGGSMAIIVGVIIAVVYWLCMAVLASAVSGVLLTALYRYGTTGKLSEYYSEQVLQNPWKL